MNLKRGSKGEDVKKIQELLGIKADGIFGPETEASVKSFQKENGLIADGIVGENTWKVFQKATAQPEFPSAILKQGSKGDDVKKLQQFLGIGVDGIFGPKTEAAVKELQRVHGISVDGIVGKETWEALANPTTDLTEVEPTPEPKPNPIPAAKPEAAKSGSIVIQKRYLPEGEYKKGPTKKEYLFLHHTAGWHNPYNTIDAWGKDSRGEVATEFVIGGQSVKGDDNRYDGEIVQAFPEGNYGWHLGQNGSQYMHTHSVGIEVCNFSYLDANNKTYAGATCVESQIVTLAKPFKGHTRWHRYSNQQIESLRQLILYIANRDSIDIHKGLIQEIKAKGAAGFEYNEDAYYGRVKGMWTHTNTRKDKSDMFPQQELLDMLLSL